MAGANPWDVDWSQAGGLPAGAVPIGSPDPTYGYKGPTAAVDLDKARAQAMEAAATAPYAGAKAAAEVQRAQAEAKLATAKAARGADVDNSGSAAVRQAAIAGYESSKQLQGVINNISSLYKSGPGATKGIAGLEDYLPTTANQRFNGAGQAARGIVGQALGFTGGQLNTAREAEMGVGPYLPQAGDRDEVIQDKIARLQDLQRTAQARAVAQLGGVPDVDGNVHPVAATVAPSAAGRAAIPSAPSGSMPPPTNPGDPTGGGQSSIVTGSSKLVDDPKVAALINTLVRRGASADEISEAISPLGYGAVSPADVARAQAYQRKNPNYKGSFGSAQRSEGTTILNRIAASPLGAGAVAAGDAVTGGYLDNLTSDPAATRAKMAALAAANPGSSLTGELIGGAVGAAGLELGGGALAARAGGLGARLLANPITADAAYGAISGSGNADDGNRLLGAGVGAVVGAGGGMFGRGVVRGVGNATRGVRNDAVQLLRDAGVPLTTGQLVSQSGRVGSAVKGIEDRLSGFPVVGDMVNARRREGFEAFNQAAFDQGLAPINATTGGVTREAGVDAARAARSQAYHDALDPVRVQADAPYAADMRGVRAAGAALPDPMAGNAAYTIPTRVDGSFGPNGELTGHNFQQSVRGLRRDAASLRNQPYGYDFEQVTRGAEDALGGLLDRQAPGAVPAYRAANEANRNVEILRDAVTRARSGTRVGEPGLFAPSQLADAASANSKRFGGSHGTTDQPFFDLTRAGQRVLPSSVPDSGTAGRAALAALGLGGLTGGGAGYVGGDAEGGTATGLGLAGLLALGGTRGGQRAITRILADRPDLAVRIGNQINRRAGIGGMFGAGAASLLPSQ